MDSIAYLLTFSDDGRSRVREDVDRMWVKESLLA
jgi:hypothetical protein